MKPRVLIFSLTYFPFVGGAEVAVKELTDRLPNFEFELITVNLDGKQKAREKYGNVEIHRLDTSKYLFPWRAASEAVKLHRAKSYDLVWAIMANQAGMAATMFKNRFPSVPFLLTLQEGDDFSTFAYRLRLLGPRFYRVFQSADHIQAISNYLARWARDRGAKCSIDVVPNGVDLEKFKSQNAKGKSANQSSKVIITTSRLVPKNGVDTLIDAMPLLPRDVKLQILGAGPDEKELKLQVSSLRLGNQVDFVGHVAPQELPKWLGGADVFVRASRSEGLGVSFLEAMVVGVPTVGTLVGGIPDFLTEDVTGWVCQVNDPQSIANKVNLILDPANQELVSRVTTQAKNLVGQHYNWDNLAQRMAKILDKMASSAMISG